MRRVWASLAAVWATLAIVAALAWSHPMLPATQQATPQRVVVSGPHGVRRVVLLQGTTPHTTTHTSTVAGG